MAAAAELRPSRCSTASPRRTAARRATAADSAALRAALPAIVDEDDRRARRRTPNAGPTQCHDITVYPAIGYAGGACEGYGLLLDIHDPAHPVRVDAVADSNFSYWHSATFNNDGTKVLFTDEWGGGGAPKCRASDPKRVGRRRALHDRRTTRCVFQGYYKMPAPQTSQENCVAHNGSLIPIPGRDIMVQAWYQGGISVFDWTDAAHAEGDRVLRSRPGRRDAHGDGRLVVRVLVQRRDRELRDRARPRHLRAARRARCSRQNEIDAAKTVHLDYLNVQGQPKFVWPARFALSRAYMDQLERSGGLSSGRLAAVRSVLSEAEMKSGADRRESLNKLAGQLDGDARGSSDSAKVQLLATSVRDLASK